MTKPSLSAFMAYPPVQMNPDPCEGERHSYAQSWQSALPPRQ
jgi:hypothetical protein